MGNNCLNSDYKIIRSPRRRCSSLIKITPQGKIEVHTTPWTPKLLIDQLVRQKQSWIMKKLKQIKQPPPQLKYIPGEKHLFFGQNYPLRVKFHHLKRPKLEFIYNRFTAFIHKTQGSQAIKKLFQDWYLKKGKKIILQKVDHFSRLLGVEYNSVRIKRVSSIWGSCSAKNNLNFNRKLIMAPHKIVDYVVIHEVCHLIHRHHQKPFWNLVKNLDPSYKEHAKWLKNNHHLLYL